jgi:hypothetical protein
VPQAFAVVKPCEELKAEIAAKLDAKVIGSCAAGAGVAGLVWLAAF